MSTLDLPIIPSELSASDVHRARYRTECTPATETTTALALANLGALLTRVVDIAISADPIDGIALAAHFSSAAAAVVEQISDLRAVLVAALAERDGLTLGGVAERIGVSTARAGQLVNVAKGLEGWEQQSGSGPAVHPRATGEVYFIQGAESKRIKIGWAGSAVQRLAVLQTGSPERLTLLASTPGAKADERALHLRFGHARYLGEWFEPVDDLLEFITSI